LSAPLAIAAQLGAFSAPAHADAYASCAAGTTEPRQRRLYSFAHVMPPSTTSLLSLSKTAEQYDFGHDERWLGSTLLSMRAWHSLVLLEKKLDGSPSWQCSAEKYGVEPDAQRLRNTCW
jgi:hypothetical protein